MTQTKMKVIRGDELKEFCENYSRPKGEDGKLIKCKNYTVEQLSDFRRWTNYKYRLQPEKQIIANEAARLAHYKRKDRESDYQQKRYLEKVGILTRPRKQILDLSTLN